MSDQPAQSYANHLRFVPAYHYVLLPLLLVLTGWALWRVVTGFSADTVFELLVILSLWLIAAFARLSPLKAQDRVIRLEERLRLAELLSPEQAARLDELESRHYVALRFASDAEVAELVEAILAGELSTQTEIKKRITTWRPDHHRV